MFSKIKLPKLTSKDKSLLLLISSTLIVIWALYSIISFLFFSATFTISDAAQLITSDVVEVTDSANKTKVNNVWINVSRPLQKSDLKDRVILLDFWNYGCATCLNSIVDTKNLQKEFGNKLTIIGVHAGRFDAEKDFNSIKKAVMKYGIEYPVINDFDHKIAKSFQVKHFPTLVLINARGDVKKIYEGDYSFKKLRKDVNKYLRKFKYQITRDALPIVLEKNKFATHILNYPTKLEYSTSFSYKSHNAPAIFIANSGDNKIVVSSIDGDMIEQIGSGVEGYKDGNFKQAQFNSPSGMVYYAGKLYVADSGNNLVREIDFANGKVSTLIGSGGRGTVLSHNEVPVNKIDLSLPLDVEFYPDKNHLVIANSGSNQILSYDFESKKVSILAGSGKNGMDDGKNTENSLAQTSDLYAYGGKLYFLDLATSALRVVDKEGLVKTLIGQDLDKFGHSNGNKENALMQHPSGLTVDDTGVYIVDSFNNVVRKYDFSNAKLNDLIGGNQGTNLGKKAQFDEPNGIISLLDKFYVADTNNNRLVAINRSQLSATLLDVMPPLEFSKEGFLQYLPNLYKADEVNVDIQNVVMKVNLKTGWKINPQGPSFINLLELIDNDNATLIKTFDWNMIIDNDLALPVLTDNKEYMLQGTIYYCEEKQNSLCHVSSYQQKIKAKKGSNNKEINIELIYQ